MSASERVRLDKWLWAARLFKTRTLAAEAIEFGRVRVNGERVKPAREARVGDRLDIAQRDTRLEVMIRGLALQRGPASVAQQLYEESDASAARRERQREAHRLGAEPARTLRGRPTKKDARLLSAVRRSRDDSQLD